MAQQAKQRRGLVRVDDVIEISHRPITQAEFQSLSRDIESRSASQGVFESVDSLLEAAGRSVDPNSPTWKAISLLDKKLDFIISIVQEQTRVKDTEYERAEVNLSGSGIRFASRQLYRKGDLLWLGFVLPTTPPTQMEAIGEVARIGASVQRRTETPTVTLSVNFVSINAKDSEEVLKYCFQRQREILRQKKAREG